MTQLNHLSLRNGKLSVMTRSKIGRICSLGSYAMKRKILISSITISITTMIRILEKQLNQRRQLMKIRRKMKPIKKTI